MRIKYFKNLSKKIPELFDIVEIICSDNKITQTEIYSIFNEIRNSKTIPKSKKKYLISNLSNIFVKNNKVIDSNELLRSFDQRQLKLPIALTRLKCNFTKLIAS